MPKLMLEVDLDLECPQRALVQLRDVRDSLSILQILLRRGEALNTTVALFDAAANFEPIGHWRIES